MKSLPNTNTFISLFFILTFICFSSCKSKNIPLEIKANIETAEIVNQFVNPPVINSFNTKARIKFNDDYGSQKATLFLRAKRDSAIFMVFKKMSVEGGRALITPDSIFIINRLEKQYQILPITKIQNDYGLMPDFGYIYDMLIGINPSVDTSEHWNLNLTKDALNIESVIKGILHNFEIDRKEGYVVKGYFMNKINIDAVWEYENYQFISDSISLPFYRQYEFSLPNDENLNITLDFSEIELNIDKPIKFKIPEHYQRIN